MCINVFGMIRYHNIDSYICINRSIRKEPSPAHSLGSSRSQVNELRVLLMTSVSLFYSVTSSIESCVQYLRVI